jgi:hypothetical protein
MNAIVTDLHFAESPRWHDDRLWFSDFYGGVVQSVRPDGSGLRLEASRAGAAVRLGVAARRPLAGRLHAGPSCPAARGRRPAGEVPRKAAREAGIIAIDI